METFGQLLHEIRSRQNASQLVKKVGISYVYLLDIEKGARTAPKEDILIALAENLEFREGEKEKFFDLAGIERKTVPVDVSNYMIENKELINFVREVKRKEISMEYINMICSKK